MMKRLLVLVCCSTMVLSLFAKLQIGEPQPLKNTEDKGLFHPVFSPRGDFMLFSTQGYRGLMYYDMTTAEMRQLTDADNAGTDVRISEGGKMVVFRKVDYINNRRFTSIQRVEVKTGEIKQLREPSRVKYTFDFAGGLIRIINREALFTKRVLTDISTPNDTNYLVAIEDFDLVLYVNNVRYVLNPLGKQSYLFPSISPDKQHILFYAMQGGTCVCDINGKNVRRLGHVNAPVWLGNEYVVGMQDETDGEERYINSPLIFVKYDGTEKQVYSVPNHPIVLYPAANQQGTKVAFEADGTIYVIDITHQK